MCHRFVGESRLANTGLSRDQRDRAASRVELGDPRIERSDLTVPSH
jgi:hypothetical protein